MLPPYLSIQFITQFQYLLLNIIMNEIFWGNLEHNYTRGLYPGLGIGCMLMLIITEHPARPYSDTDVARCRDGDVSRVSLKYDATECSPGLLSMEWYPSLLLAAAECKLWLVRMEWYPSLFLEFFHQLVFPCRPTYSSETRGTIPTSLLVFVENVFTPLIYVMALVPGYAGRTEHGQLISCERNKLKGIINILCDRYRGHTSP